MNRLRAFFIALLAILTFTPVAPVFAQPHHSPGTIAIDVVDQDNRPISGAWFLYEGTGSEGQVIRNGTEGEEFLMNYGTYFLAGQRKAGYERFEIVGENPQTTVPRGFISYKMVYYVEGYAAAQTAPQEEPAMEAPAEEAPAAEPAVEEEPAPATEEPQAEEMMPEEEEEVAPVRRELERSPLHVEAPVQDRLAYTGEPMGVNLPEGMQLAVTGPEGLLVLMFGSGLSGLLFTRRRKA